MASASCIGSDGGHAAAAQFGGRRQRVVCRAASGCLARNCATARLNAKSQPIAGSVIAGAGLGQGRRGIVSSRLFRLFERERNAGPRWSVAPEPDRSGSVGSALPPQLPINAPRNTTVSFLLTVGPASGRAAPARRPLRHRRAANVPRSWNINFSSCWAVTWVCCKTAGKFPVLSSTFPRYCRPLASLPP